MINSPGSCYLGEILPGIPILVFIAVLRVFVCGLGGLGPPFWMSFRHFGRPRAPLGPPWALFGPLWAPARWRSDGILYPFSADFGLPLGIHFGTSVCVCVCFCVLWRKSARSGCGPLFVDAFRVEKRAGCSGSMRLRHSKYLGFLKGFSFV